MRDKLTPLYILIGIVYIKSVDTRISIAEYRQYLDILNQLVAEYKSHIKDGTEPDIQIVRK